MIDISMLPVKEMYYDRESCLFIDGYGIYSSQIDFLDDQKNSFSRGRNGFFLLANIRDSYSRLYSFRSFVSNYINFTMTGSGKNPWPLLFGLDPRLGVGK